MDKRRQLAETPMTTIRRFGNCDRGTAALEFAIISPIFILVLMTLIAYGIYLSAAHSVQQIAANAARTAVAGVTQAERVQLVNTYITTSTLNDPILQRSNFTVTVSADPANVNQFVVSLAYNAQNLPIWNLYSFAMPSQTITRTATIRMGGI
jgi:Flp pilus assembly protein TadG